MPAAAEKLLDRGQVAACSPPPRCRAGHLGRLVRRRLTCGSRRARRRARACSAMASSSKAARTRRSDPASERVVVAAARAHELKGGTRTGRVYADIELAGELGRCSRRRRRRRRRRRASARARRSIAGRGSARSRFRGGAYARRCGPAEAVVIQARDLARALARRARRHGWSSSATSGSRRSTRKARRAPSTHALGGSPSMSTRPRARQRTHRSRCRRRERGYGRHPGDRARAYSASDRHGVAAAVGPARVDLDDARCAIRPPVPARRCRITAASSAPLPPRCASR